MAIRRLRPTLNGRGALLAITLLALALRLARLDFQPLWWDEGYSVWFANQPLAEMVRLTALDIHPPLYYALLHGWSRLLGLAPAVLRLASVGVGVLAVPLIYAVGGLLAGRQAGLLAALLLAINPFHVFYSQEVRMYALAALWSLLALGFAARWLDIAGKVWPGNGSRWAAVGYVVATTLALYTLYYVGFLAVGLTVAGLWLLWRRNAAARRRVAWLGAQVAVLLLYLPWLVYAAPRLVPYVSQKVVADSDRPLGLLEYLARHLAAFGAGHLEGPLARWWPIGLLGLLPLAWGLWRVAAARFLGRRNQPHHPPDRGPNRRHGSWPEHRQGHVIGFLLITLVTVLVLGWLVNRSFPFFPERGERLLLVALPLFVLLVTVTAQTATGGDRRANESRPRARRRPIRSRSYAAPLCALLFTGLATLSLAGFYTVPRYADEDYRPLIGQVTQWGRPQDAVLAVFPWQVGYFWSYGSPDGPQPLLFPQAEWDETGEQVLAAALARGHVWFPEHLALGGRLEATIEEHLAGRGYNLVNRWYSPSTRLTGWAAPWQQRSGPSCGQPDPCGGQQGQPLLFGPSLVLTSFEFGPPSLKAANEALRVSLNWQATDLALSENRHVSLRLAGADGRTWAQRDFSPPAGATADRIGLLVPAGTPPGRYDLRLSLSRQAGGTPLEVTGPDGQPLGSEANLGQVQIVVPETPPSSDTLPIEQQHRARLGDSVRLLGFSATAGPLSPGDDLKVSLFWQALPGLAVAPGDFFAFVQLLDGQAQVAAAWEGPPVAWHPTSAWQPGDLVRSQHTLRLPATLADGRYRLIAGLFDPVNGRRLALPPEILGRSKDYIELSRVQIVGREHVMQPPTPQVALSAKLAWLGRLVGYDLAEDSVTAGQALDLTLYWQATETTDQRLKVFVHLLDSAGQIIGQSDQEPGAGAWPTSSWLPGEYLADQHSLIIQPDAPVGPATLKVGLYDPISGERVQWLDGSGQPAGDTLSLPIPITVGPP